MKKSVVVAAIALGVAAVLLLHFAGSDAARVTVTLTPGPPQPRVPPGEAGLDPAALEAAVTYAGARRSSALIVGRGGHIAFEKYWGATHIDTPVDPGFAPVLAALALGSAIDERLVASLDVPLSNYLHDGAAAGITLQQLMDGSREVPSVEESTNLLARVLEQVSARPYQAIVAQRLWTPLGGGTLEFRARPDEARPQGVNAGCCVRARVGDWMRVAEALANDGAFEGNQIVPPGYVERKLKPAQRRATHGFTRVDGDFAARDVLWLDGSQKQRLWIVPSLKLTILRLGDSPSAAEGWDEAMIPNYIIHGTSGWKAATAGEGIDPNNYAPH